MNIKRNISLLIASALTVLCINPVYAQKPNNYTAYTDDFSGYDSGNAVVDVTDFADVAEKVCENDSGAWIPSSVRSGKNINPAVADDFEGYTTEHNTYDSGLQYLNAAGNVFLDGSGYSWRLSAKHQGANNTDTARVFLNNGKMCMYGGNKYVLTTLNLDMGDKKLKSLNRVSADVSNNTGRANNNIHTRPYINLLVNDEEDTYYAFCIATNDTWETDPVKLYYGYTPFVMKIKNNERDTSGSVIGLGNNGVISAPYGAGQPDKFGYPYTDAHWDIQLDEQTGAISWEVTVNPKDSGLSAQTWRGSVTDPELPQLMKNAKYPMASGVALNDASFDNIRVYMDIEGEETGISVNGKTHVDVNKGALGAGGSETDLSSVNFVPSEELPDTNVRTLKFKSERVGMFSGVSAFISGDEESFYLFGQAGDKAAAPFLTDNSARFCPAVIKYKNGAKTLVAHDTAENGWNSRTNAVDWSIRTEGNTVYYTAVCGSLKWSGKFTDSDEILKNAKFPFAVSGLGSGIAGYVTDVEYEGGEYYTGGMGEPYNTFYTDISEGRAQDENFVTELENDGTMPVRKVYAYDFPGMQFGLSSDGVSYDTFTVDSNAEWLNENNDKAYKYIKLPGSVVEGLAVMIQTEDKTFDVEKGGTKYFYPVIGGKIPVIEGLEAEFTVADGKIASVDTYGNVTGIADGKTVLSVQNADGEKMCVNIRVVGPLTKAIESGDEQVMRDYIASQQQIADVLNNAIENNSMQSVINFIGTDLGKIDAITDDELLNISPSDCHGLAERLLTYEGFTFTNLDDIYAFEKTLLRELKTGAVLNLSSAEDVMAAISENAEIFCIDITDKYFKNRQSDILNDLTNKNFRNYGEFINRYNTDRILFNLKNTQSPAFALGLITDNAAVIGYNAAKFNAIADKNLFAKMLVNQKNNIASLVDLQNFINSYKEQQSAGPQGGGGGGSSSSSKPGGGVPLTVSPGTVQPNKDGTLVPKTELYSDVDTDFWGYEAIRFLTAKKAAAGYGDNSFMPGNKITRAEFTRMTIAVVGFEIEEDAAPEFSDVNENDWFCSAVGTAKKLGIASGADGMFMPENPVTREEMASIIYRALQIAGRKTQTDASINRFEDENEISQWAKAAVLKLQAAGIVSGADGRFNPKSDATRAEAAVILYRAITASEKEAK